MRIPAFPALPLFVACLAFISVSSHAAEVTNTTRYHDDTLGITIVSGETRLPADGNWTLTHPAASSGLSQVFVQVTNAEALHADGARTLANRIADRLRDDHWLLTTHHTLLSNYARQHGDRGPARFDDAELLALVAHYGRVLKADEKPEPEETQSRLIAEFREKIADIGLVPNAPFEPHQDPFAPKKSPPTPRSPLLLELTPALDDGKHWVLYTDYTTERVAIDTELLKKLGLTISKRDIIRDTVAQPPAEQILKLYARLTPAASGRAHIHFTDAASGRSLTVTWDWTSPSSGTRDQLSTWARLRTSEWQALSGAGEAPILNTWLKLAPDLYNIEPPKNDAGGWFDRENSLSFFALFGGRAAVQETLQLQALEARDNQNIPPSTDPSSISLSELTGVDVRPHPFAEMVRGKDLPTLPIADFVPPDRAFFYAAKPAALNQFFNPDSAFVRHVAAFSGPGANFRLRDRYAADLGLTSDLVDTLLNSGLITECAVFTPDVFFADGTDVTIITRVRSGALLGKLLAPVLAPLSSEDGFYTLPTATGHAHWKLLNDLWILSTHRGELDSALALAKQNGTGSLGRSDEFRYMLHKLPPTADTRAYVYFSDAFIRRLVSPEVKIAQTRRMKARLAMEHLVAAALLRRLDAPEASATIEDLARLGYFQSDHLPADTVLAPDCSIRSAIFGSLARMQPLSAQAASITQVTAREAAAYKEYRETYARFWSRYFDPIALRLDTTPDEQHSLTTFILPLVENTAYNDLRESLDAAATPSQSAAITPVFNRAPLAQLNLRLTEDTWRSVARGTGDLLKDYVSLDPRFYDLLGPSFHIAFENSDSVVRLDNAEAANLVLPGRRATAPFGWALQASAFVHFFTRPTHMAVELSDPLLAARILDSAHSHSENPSPFSRYLSVQFHRRGKSNEWLLSVRPLDIASIDFSLRIDGRYLLISNNPAGEPLRVTGGRTAGNGAASLSFNPQNRTAGSVGDFISAMRAEQQRALIGMGHTYPWMLVFDADSNTAAEHHARVLGFTPTLPSGELTWKGSALEHSVFGTAAEPRLPSYDPAVRFGLFENLSEATVSMQFEDDGLRTELRWRLLPSPDRP